LQYSDVLKTAYVTHVPATVHFEGTLSDKVSDLNVFVLKSKNRQK